MRETTISVSTDGGTYNGKIIFHQLFVMILRAFLLAMFSVRIHTGRFFNSYFSQEEINNATPDMSKPYTIDESGNVHES